MTRLYTMADIARQVGITRERVRQIIEKQHLAPSATWGRWRLYGERTLKVIREGRWQRACARCGAKVPPPRWRYCSAECSEAEQDERHLIYLRRAYYKRRGKGRG